MSGESSWVAPYAEWLPEMVTYLGTECFGEIIVEVEQ